MTAMRRITLFIIALFAISSLSAQTYKVGDVYSASGKKGVVFEVTADGKHGKIVALTEPKEVMTWAKAMEWGKQLKDGWCLPSRAELLTLFEVKDVVAPVVAREGDELIIGSNSFYWAPDEFGVDFAWIVSLQYGSNGGSFKGNEFHIRAVSAF